MAVENPSIDIIIVNWNSEKQLLDCLVAVQQTNKVNFRINRVCVIDNCSNDQSLFGVETLDLPLELIRNNENRGFGEAVNQGVCTSTSDYLLLLNPDTRLLENSLAEPVKFLENPENNAVGIVGIQNIDEHGKTTKTCTRFPTPRMLVFKSLGLTYLFPGKFVGHFMTEWHHQASRVVDHVMGSFYMVRNSIWQKLKGFDTRFFMYYEDLDFSFRARKDGVISIYLCDAQVFHRGGGTSEKIKARRLFYSLRSCLYYANKHFKPQGFIAVAIVTLLIEPWTRIASALFRLRLQEVGQTLHGYAMLFRDLPNIYRRMRRYTK
jgi:GT2 family glycosyltransferase